MTYTFATVLIPTSDISQAQDDMPGFFTAEFSATGEAPAEYYVSTGSFADSELDHLANEVSYKRIIKFGPAEAVFESMGLKMVVQEPVNEE